jgi:hypothetical protein
MAAGGRKGMAHRWAGHEAATVHVRMSELDPAMRAVVRSMLNAARSFEATQKAAPSAFETSESAARTKDTRNDLAR